MSWREGTLSELAFFQRGYDITKKEQRPGPYPVVSSSGTKSHHAEFKVAGPGVVIGRKGTLGTVHFIHSDFWPHDTSLWVKDFNGNHPRFVYYFIHMMDFARFDVGGANPTLNRNHIHGLPIRIPSLPVQTRIADILSAYDDLIENNNRRMALLEEAIHLLYREWFVYLRFPGHERVKVVDGVPEGWERATLGAVVDQVRKGVKPAEVEPSTPYVGLEHIPKRCIALQAWGAAEDVTSNKFRFDTSDILFGKIRPYFHKVVVAPVAGICSSDTIVMRPKDPSDFALSLGVTASKRFVDHVWQTAKIGAKMPRANWKVMSEYPLLRPSPTGAERFSEQVEISVSQILNLVNTNRRLREARDLLLPRLMNGSIAV